MSIFYWYNNDNINYYDGEDFCILSEPEKQINKVYEINDNILLDGIKNLKKKGLPKRNTDFTPKNGVLGELNMFFKKNKIDY